MGKRKHSDREKYDNILKKLRKLEKKVKRSKERISTSPSSDNSVASPTNLQDGSLFEKAVEDDEENSVDLEILSPSRSEASRVDREPSPIASTSRVALAASTSIEQSTLAQSQSNTVQLGCENSIDNTLTELLGDDPALNKLYGNEINSGLASRIQHILTNGLTKETRKELQGKYLPPSNCALIDAPVLNPEIKAAVSETISKRDRGIELKQKMLGCAITCIAETISSLLVKEDKNTELIKVLMDACRIICDCQNNDSVTRRNFVLYNLKKEMRDQLQKTKIDSSLFGSDLAETIKIAKNISKSGAELKSLPPNKPPVTKLNKQTPVSTSQRSLNWKAPPLNRRPKGGQEQKEPAPRRPPPFSSRTSYQAPPPKNRNRR